jgi:hypothetical protein
MVPPADDDDGSRSVSGLLTAWPGSGVRGAVELTPVAELDGRGRLVVHPLLMNPGSHGRRRLSIVVDMALAVRGPLL